MNVLGSGRVPSGSTDTLSTVVHPSLIVLLACSVLTGAAGCRSRGSDESRDAQVATGELLRPTCSTLEAGACPIEGIELPLEAPLPGPTKNLFVSCVLSAEGNIEACRGLDERSRVLRQVRESLEQRQYVPVTFRGQPVPVPYLFFVTRGPSAGPETASSESAASHQALACSALEYDRCTAERVIVDESALAVGGGPGELWTNHELDVRCIVRETGAVELCEMDRAPEAVSRVVRTVLERRRYSPARYRGRAVPVAYEFKVTLSLLPSKARLDFRRAAFEFLVDETTRVQGDAGVHTLCLALGEDESPAEATQIRRPGWEIRPVAQCTRGFPWAYAHLVEFDVLDGRGTARAMVGRADVGGESLALGIERVDAGWQFRVNNRSNYEH